MESGRDAAWRACADASERQHRLGHHAISSGRNNTPSPTPHFNLKRAGEFAQLDSPEIFSIYTGLQAWSGSPGPYPGVPLLAASVCRLSPDMPRGLEAEHTRPIGWAGSVSVVGESTASSRGKMLGLFRAGVSVPPT